MNYKIFSYYDENYKEVAYYQQLVFNKFGLHVNQTCQKDDGHETNYIYHGQYLEDVLNHESAELYIFFDIDCIPLSADFLDVLIEKVKDKNTLSGAVGCANHIDPNFLYIHPCFMGLTKEVYKKCGSPSLLKNNNNDVAQNLTRACIDNNINLHFWDVTGCDNDKWSLGKTGKRFGLGTYFDDIIFHQYEICKDLNNSTQFINKCKSIL